MNFLIREIDKTEIPVLKDFLYDAIFLPEGAPPPPRDIIYTPELWVYVSRFGQLVHDRAFVAELDGNIVGAVWCRVMDDYGHIDDDTPSLAISVKKGYRNIGIGALLLDKMLSHLIEKGYHAVSLSVQKANFAVQMYERAGFEVFEDKGEEYVMLRRFP